MSEKALAIGTYFVASGVYTIFGVSSPVGGSEEVSRLISQGWEKLVSGKLEFITDPGQMLQKALAHIDAKRSALKLAPYDPGRWSASGDRRMRELEKLPPAGVVRCASANRQPGAGRDQGVDQCWHT